MFKSHTWICWVEIQQKCEVQRVKLHSLKVKLESVESETSIMEEGKHFKTKAAESSEHK